MLTPEDSFGDGFDFRPAITAEYLPTPPASVSSTEEAENIAKREPPSSPDYKMDMAIKEFTPNPGNHVPSFRRRIGRGGRMVIDRRMAPHSPPADMDYTYLERHKYDQEDDGQVPVYEWDIFDHKMMYMRAHHARRDKDAQAAVAAAAAAAQRRAQGEAAAASAANGPPTPKSLATNTSAQQSPTRPVSSGLAQPQPPAMSSPKVA